MAEKHVRWIHIDVADGTFTPRAAWHTASDLDNFKTPASIEIHFMVERPEEKIAPWLATLAKRIIFHIESTEVADDLITLCHNAGKEAGVAVRPDSSWEGLLPFIGKADLLQTLAVNPGPSAQAFDRLTLEKLKNLRARDPRIMLEVDGGVRVGVARECREAGANFIVVGSSLFTGEHSFEQMLANLEHDIAT